LGYVRVGQSVRLKSLTTTPGENCRLGFYQVEPRGFVCNDSTITLDPEHRFLRNNAVTNPDSGAHPYRFALSNGAPMYARLPTESEQQRYEGSFGKAGTFARRGYFERGYEHLATTAPIVASDEPPDFVAQGLAANGHAPLSLLVRPIPHGSMLSFTRAFASGGRTWLLSTDLTIVPADRVRVFERSEFRGVELGNTVQLPIAWFRFSSEPRAAYRRSADGSFAATGDPWLAKSWAPLSGRSEEHAGKRYLEVKGESGLWADAAQATLVEARSERPFGVKPGEKWMLISITRGTLVAYDDLRPVYATLISPGIGGLPRPQGTLLENRTTPLGSYRITFKDRATTMSPEITGSDEPDANRSWIADVPFTQYFAAPFALHGSYWHDLFGEPISAGCVNASPLDAKWLFDWSDPQVPEGWHGASGAGAPENGGGSWVIITR
jgi:hypothetical protein